MIIIKLIFPILLISLSSCSMHSHKTDGGKMNTIFSSELTKSEITNDNWREIALKFKPSDNLTFEIKSPFKFEKNNIIIIGNLINKSINQENIIVFPIGNLGFYAKIIENTNIKHIAPKDLPQEPPPPTEITIPGNTSVKYTCEIDLADYKYVDTPNVRIEWSFNYWNEPKPTGIIETILPKN